MEQKSYIHSKKQCKICILFKNDPAMAEAVDFDIVSGMNYLDFVRKYNKIVEEMGLNVRIVSSNFYNHRKHMSLKDVEGVLKKKTGIDVYLTSDCSDLKQSYVLENKFLKTTFRMRLLGLNDMQNILNRKQQKRDKLFSKLQEIENRLGVTDAASPDYNRLLASGSKLERELESTEVSIRDHIRDINDILKQIEIHYGQSVQKYSQENLEGEVRKYVSALFFRLNDGLNRFVPMFQDYLQYDEFPEDRARSSKVLFRTSRIFMNTVNRAIDYSARALPFSMDISQVPGVTAVEDTLKSLSTGNSPNAKPS